MSSFFWPCLSCTFADNPGSFLACSLCGLPRESVAGLMRSLTAGDLDSDKVLDSVIALMHYAERDPKGRDQMITKDAIEPLLSIFRSHKDDDNNPNLRTAAALTIAYLLRSCYPRRISFTADKKRSVHACLDFLRDSKRDMRTNGFEISTSNQLDVSNQARNYFTLINSQGLQRQLAAQPPSLKREGSAVGATLDIESALFSLGSLDLDRKMDALKALMKYAKESPTQRPLMYNYGLVTRLMDIIRSEDAMGPKLKLIATMTVAYIVPSLDRTISSNYKEEILVSLARLEMYGEPDVAGRGVGVSKQEVQWSIQSLEKISREEDEDKAEPMIKKNPAHGPVKSLNVEDLYHRKDVVRLLELLRVDSCRQLDAALLLIALTKTEKDTAHVICSSGGIHILHDIFFYWTEASDDLRTATAIIVSLLVPSESGQSVERRMLHCTQYVQENHAKTQHMLMRSANKVTAPSLKLEPTLYNFMRDDGFVGVITLNSLGFIREAQSWLWEDIMQCQMDSKVLSSVGFIVGTKRFLLDLQNEVTAQRLVRDVLDRLRIFRDRRDQSQEASSLFVPKVLDISYADRPEFLGVSVYHLKHHFLPQVEATPGLSANSKFYKIENLVETKGFVRQKGKSTVCPLDGRLGAAYCHCLKGEDHVGLATYMLSWTWSYTARDVVQTLDSYCEAQNLDPKRTYVWICCLCLNQHRVVESNMSGITSESSAVDFENEFRRRVIGIGRVLIMMRPWGDPLNLKRIWCIFEYFMALTNDCEVHIVMPPGERDRIAMDLFSSGIDSLYKALNQVDVEKAKASVESDRERILDLIRGRTGFQAVNLLVRERLRGWVRGVIDDLVEERARNEQESLGDDAMGKAAKLSYGAFLKQVGDLFFSYGDYSAAYAVYQKCGAIREAVLGFHHLDVAETYTDMGRSLFSQGLTGQSIEMYLSALRIREKCLTKNHLDTARTYFHVGQLLQDMGDVNEALVMMQKCQLIQEEKLGTEHRDTAVTYSYIGALLGESDLVDVCDQGLEMACKSRVILEQSVGKDHPDTALCYGFISQLLQDRNLDEALVMAEQCCSIQERVLGKDHPVLATSYRRLGTMYLRQGRLDDSMDRFSKSLEIHKCSSRMDSIAKARTYASMSAVAFHSKEQDKARDFHIHVLAILEESSGKLDQPLVLIYSSAGETLYDKGEHETAIILFRQGLDVMAAMLGKNHPDLAAGHEAIGLTLYTKGDYGGAIEEYQRSLTIRKVTMEEDSTKVLETTQLIAGITTQWLECRRGSIV